MTVVEDLEALAGEVDSPSVAWGVVLDGRLALHGGVAASASTIFRIASMTKSFTAATVLAQRDAGVLRLDDEIAALAGQRATTDSPAVTIRHVLSMSAGLPEDDPWADRHLDMPRDVLDRLVRDGVAYSMPTGTGYEYSNLGYALLGDLAGQTDELLLRPLGMHRTTWTVPDRPEALGHGAFAGMGGLWSCVEDLATWVSWFDDAFPPRDDPDDGPLRRSTRREMQQVHRAKDDGGGYGFGLSIERDDRFGTIVGHSGGLPGYGSNMRWLPGRRVGAIALADATYAPMGRLTRRMLDVLDTHGLVPPVVVPVTPALRRATEDLVALLTSWDGATADRLFADNVGLDDPYPRLAAAAAELGGDLRLDSIIAETATEGRATVAGPAGPITLHVRLGPLADGRVERYTIHR